MYDSEFIFIHANTTTVFMKDNVKRFKYVLNSYVIILFVCGKCLIVTLNGFGFQTVTNMQII